MSEALHNKHWKNFLSENNDHSFACIYNECVNGLYTYGIGLGFSSDECMDAVQDLFYKLYVTKNELRHVANIRSYLFRSLRNRLFDAQKRQSRQQTLETEDLSLFPVEVSVSERIEDEEERALLKQKVEKLLSLLTDRQREAVYLRYMQNLEYEDIAAILEMRPESVRKLVYRALEAIRENVQNRSLPLILLIAQLF